MRTSIFSGHMRPSLLWVKKRKAVKFTGTGDGGDIQEFRGTGVLKKVERILKLLRMIQNCLEMSKA